MSTDASDERRRAIRAFMSSLISAALGIIASVGSIVAFIYSFQLYQPSFRYYDSFVRERIEETVRKQQNAAQIEVDRIREKAERINIELQKTRDDLVRLSAQSGVTEQPEAADELVKQLTTMRTSVEKVASRLDSLDKQSGAIDSRMSKLETAILADPQKVLELPLLKKDLQAFQQQVDRELNALKTENARVYDLMKWLIGLMALVSLSLVGTAIGNVFKREPARNEEAKPSNKSEKSTV